MRELASSLLADINSVTSGLGEWFYNNLIWFQIIGGLISLFFIWIIIHSIRKSDYHYFHADALRDRLNIKNLPMVRAKRSWKIALRHVGSRHPAKWRLAVLEAEKIVKDWLTMKSLLVEVEGLNQARSLARDLKNNETLEISKDQAIEALRAYKKALRELGIVGA